MKKKIASSVLLFCLVVTMLPLQAFAAGEGNAEFTITGTRLYSEAYKVLDHVNSLRKGLGLNKLKMNVVLLDAAMLRSHELVVYYSHTRPDDTDCFTVADDVWGENIAVGFNGGNGDAQKVFTSWKNSPGHYRNMINPSHRSIGVGCLKKGKNIYWVQLFGRTLDPVGTKPGDKTASATVAAAAKHLHVRAGDTVQLTTRSSKKKLTLKLNNASWPYGGYSFPVSELNYAVADTKVATVSAKGYVKPGMEPGTTTVTVSVKSAPQLRTTYTIRSSATKDGRVAQTIKGVKKSYTKTVSSKAFRLKPKASGGGRLRFSSSDKSVVTVSSKGRVKVKGPGIAVIKITAGQTSTHRKVTKSVVIKVRPRVPAGVAAAKTAEGLTVRWTENGAVTGREILVSANPAFNGAVRYTAPGDATSHIITTLPAGNWYVKVRSYIDAADGTRVYSKYCKPIVAKL